LINSKNQTRNVENNALQGLLSTVCT